MDRRIVVASGADIVEVAPAYDSGECLYYKLFQLG